MFSVPAKNNTTMPNHPANAPAPREQFVELVNVAYPKDRLLHVYGQGYVMPEPGSKFTVLRRHVRMLMTKHGGGGRIASPAQAAQLQQRIVTNPPPGYVMMTQAEADSLRAQAAQVAVVPAAPAVAVADEHGEVEEIDESTMTEELAAMLHEIDALES